ncbi:hypothetical protein APHCR_0257 [Anaplasma phagocytophilum str. CR1007]|nr:hypothetical protein APHHGE2_1047 [Anaplasma phagocytophilum str. HGE2]KJV98853.1 hypothetical protein OTSANNIE_1020 [Anaplasma phagocytophilum str. Annie]KJZ99481.1 hypothetical protein APHCR_0257 [Anaplasma phagocytophilum str. CR1007]
MWIKAFCHSQSDKGLRLLLLPRIQCAFAAIRIPDEYKCSSSNAAPSQVKRLHL